MIGSLRGVVLATSGTIVLVEVNGVGYRVSVTPSTLADIGPVGTEIFLHVHHHIREDAQTLFGFVDADGREVFETLLGTHGVGPALALAILGVHSPASLRRVIADEDVASMCLVPGVGKKTAQRLMIELANKLGDVPTDGEDGPASGTAADGEGESLRDIRDALEGLGYSSDEITSALRDMPGDVDLADGVRQALRTLAGG